MSYMVDSPISKFRRVGPRVPVSSFCFEYMGSIERSAVVVELSSDGIRLSRPDTGIAPRRMQLEFELPDLDELIWAEGEVCHEVVEQVVDGPGGLSGDIRTSGIRFVRMAESQQRLLRQYVRYLRDEAAMARDTEWCSHLPGVSPPRQFA